MRHGLGSVGALRVASVPRAEHSVRSVACRAGGLGAERAEVDVGPAAGSPRRGQGGCRAAPTGIEMQVVGDEPIVAAVSRDHELYVHPVIALETLRGGESACPAARV